MRVLLTGASRGIGADILSWLVAERHDVVTISRSRPDPQFECEWLTGDLSSREDLERLGQQLLATSFDVLINNAGGGQAVALGKIELPVVEREMTLNLTSVIYLTSLVSQGMVDRGFGRIINISSIAGRTGTDHLFAYGAAKSGVIVFTQAAALHMRGTGVTVNAICPGGIDTPESLRNRRELSALRGLAADEYQETMAQATGVGMIDAQDIIRVIELMIRTPAISGQSVNVCGLLQMN